MFHAEQNILILLGFHVHIIHPHNFLINYLKSLNLIQNQELTQTAWNYLNDRYVIFVFLTFIFSLRTTIPIKFQPSCIACGVIFLTCRKKEVTLPNNWWKVFDSFYQDLEEIAAEILELYTLEIKFNLPISTQELCNFKDTGVIKL
jgi:hypothetical protein